MAIGWALFIDILIYVAIVEWVRRHFFPFDGFVNLNQPQIIRYFLYSLALSEFFLISKFSNLPIKKSEGKSINEQIDGLRMSAFITFGCCESVSLMGLVLFLLTGLYFDFYVFIGINLIYLAIFFPRLDMWRHTIDGANC